MMKHEYLNTGGGTGCANGDGGTAVIYPDGNGIKPDGDGSKVKSVI